MVAKLEVRFGFTRSRRGRRGRPENPDHRSIVWISDILHLNWSIFNVTAIKNLSKLTSSWTVFLLDRASTNWGWFSGTTSGDSICESVFRISSVIKSSVTEVRKSLRDWKCIEKNLCYFERRNFFRCHLKFGWDQPPCFCSRCSRTDPEEPFRGRNGSCTSGLTMLDAQ